MCKYQDMHMSQLILSAKKNLKKKNLTAHQICIHITYCLE